MNSKFRISYKILAVICSFAILWSAVSGVACNIFALSADAVWDGTTAAEFASGSGSADDPYLIETPAQLALMATGTDYKTKKITGLYYKLTTDLYLNDTEEANWKENNPNKWLTAKTDSNYFFNGNFDGDGHTIHGLYCNGSFQRMGLFPGITGNVSVKNVVIADSYLHSDGGSGLYVGTFAGFMYQATSTAAFENCYVAESVSLEAEYSVAGFVGYGACESITFANCASFADVKVRTEDAKNKTKYGSFVGDLIDGSRKVGYAYCIGNLAYTKFNQNPTYTASYCAEEGTVDNNNAAYPTVVRLEDMQGEAAKTNMPDLDWLAWKTTEKFPALTFFNGSVVYSFENWNTAAGGKSSGMEISTDHAKEGAHSLVYDLVAASKTNYAVARVAGLSEGVHIATADAGYLYDLSFWYKLDATPTNPGKFVVYTMSPKGGASTTDEQGFRVRQTLDQEVVFDKATEDWVNAKVRFQASLAKDEYNAIGVGVVGVNGVVDTPIYLDEVSVEKAAEICRITAHYNDEADTVKVINAAVGAPVTIPSVERPGYYIEGWYTNPGLTEKFDPSKMRAGEMDIYAKWAPLEGKVVCDFEDYPYTPGNGMVADCYSVASGAGVDESKALKYATKSGITNWWNSRLAGIAIGHTPYTVKENQLYKVSFRYFVPATPDATVNVYLWTGNKANITDMSGALQQTVSEELLIDGDTPTGQWLTYTASFTAKTYDAKNANLNALAIGFVTGQKVTENAVVYVDNFEVEEVKSEDQTTVTVHTQETGETQVFHGVSGHRLAEPPVRKGYLFEGWYADAALQTPVKEVKFPETGNLDLYAKWKRFQNGDSITIGFDDYTYISGSKQFYPWYSLNHTDSADGDGTCVMATMDASCSTTMLLAYKGYPVPVEDGARYLVSFSYKNVDEIPNKWSTRIYVSSPLNCGIGINQQSNEDAAYLLTLSRAAGYGTWKRHTYSFTASLKYPGYNALAVNMKTNSFTEVESIRALIDSVTIKRIADDDIVCMTNTLAGPDYVVGKRDEKIVLPTDLQLEGYKFLGWFMDSSYDLEAADLLFSEDTVFYAKWARMKLTQDFEAFDFPGYGIGYDLDIECYNSKAPGFSSANVYSGSTSLHRIGKAAADKKFTLIADANDKIAMGETYKITYYVKLLSTKNEDAGIYVLPTDSYFYPGAADTDMAIPSVELRDLYPGIWYKITNVVTLYAPYLAVKTPGSSELYFDNFTLELVNGDTVLSDSEKVVPLGKVPAKPAEPVEEPEDDFFEDVDYEDVTAEDSTDEEDTAENPDESVDEEPEDNASDADEQAPQEGEDSKDTSAEKSANPAVWIWVIVIAAVVLVAAAVLAALSFKKRGQK